MWWREGAEVRALFKSVQGRSTVSHRIYDDQVNYSAMHENANRRRRLRNSNDKNELNLPRKTSWLS